MKRSNLKAVSEDKVTGYFNYRLNSDSQASLKTYYFTDITKERFLQLKNQFSAKDLYFLYGFKLVTKNQ